MPEPVVVKEEGAAEAPKPVVDAFGTERDSTTGLPIAPAAKVEDKKPELGEDGKPKVEVKPKEDADNLENNPVVVKLRESIKKLEEDKGSMGTNLSKQNDIIKKAQDEIKRLKDGGTAKVEPMFKDIKRVKDLTAEQQAEMSEAEKTLFDTLADTREAMNKTIADAATKAAGEEAKAATEAEEAEQSETFNKAVQKSALILAGSTDGKSTQAQKDMANAIIAEFNLFADNDKLSPDELIERLTKAAKLVPDYKPAKEQKAPTGKAAGAADVKDDPNGINKIVEEVKNGRTGGGTFSL